MEDKSTKEKVFFAIKFFLIVFGLVTSLVVAQPFPDSQLPNPLNFSQPYQFFHLAFYFFLASGIGLMISTIYSTSSLKYGLCQAAMGLSGTVSIKLSQYVCARKNP